MEMKIQNEDDELYRAAASETLTMRQGLEWMGKIKREEAKVAKDVDEERQKWVTRWWKGPKVVRREEERLRKNWGEVLKIVCEGKGVDGCEED